ncbi:MAG: hypothetical protein ATN31_06780 [Candidatus Epulonipiscioides saccharophilum]|nr:MAG: hypothetical protein ATN31_06780 [Epulopiscium sp. AS2M-Bin001]
MKLKKRLAGFLAAAMVCSPPLRKVEVYAYTTYDTTIKTTNSMLPIFSNQFYRDSVNSSTSRGTALFNIEQRAYDLPEDPEYFEAMQTVPLLNNWASISFDGSDGGIYEISYLVRNTVNIVQVTHQLRTDATGNHTVITTVHNSGDLLLNHGMPTIEPPWDELTPYDEVTKAMPKYSVYNSNLNRYEEFTLPDGYLDDEMNDGHPTVNKGEQDEEDDPGTAPDETIQDDEFELDPAEGIKIGGKSIIGKIVQTVDTNSKFLADFGNTVKLIGSGNDFNFKYIFEKTATGKFKFHLSNSGIESGTIVNYTIKELNALDETKVVRKENLQILKQLANFTGKPTHYMIDPENLTELIDDFEIESPQTAGERAGFDIMFDHPLSLVSKKEIDDNPATPDVDEEDSGGYNKYQEILMVEGDDLKGKFNLMSYDGDNIQFYFDFATDEFNPSPISVHNNLLESGLKKYIPPSKEEALNGIVAGHHLIQIVQDDIFKMPIHNNENPIYLGGEDENGADLKDTKSEEFIEWSSLSNSELMNIVEIEITDDTYENPENPSEKRFLYRKYDKTGDVYTYMEYRVERVSLQDAILTYIPYKGLSDTTKYRVYNGKTIDPSMLVGVGYGYISDSIPVPILSEGAQGYLMEVVISDKTTLSSQYLNYNAAIDKNIKPPTPIIDEIKNIYVVPPEVALDPTQAIGFDLTFTAPKNTEDNQQLDQFVTDGVLYYEFFMYESKETPINGRIYSKIFKVDRESDNALEPIEVTSYAGQMGEAYYNQSSETFTVEDVLIKRNNGMFNWNHLDNSDFLLDEYLTAENYPPAPEELDDLSHPQWDVGKTYYFTVRAVYDRDPNLNPPQPGQEEEVSTLTYSNESNPVAITFTNKNEVLPIVTIITDESVIVEDPTNPDDINKANQKINFNIVNLENFIDFMLDPVDWEYKYEDEYGNPDKYDRTYEVFLYQKDDPILDDFENAKEIWGSDITTVVPGVSVDVNMNDYILNLRRGDVVRLDFRSSDNVLPSYLWPTVEFQGLDQNQTYYVQIRTRVDNKSPDVKSKYSTFSKIHTFTTHVNPKPPGPEEQKPPTPADFWIEEQTSNTSVVLRWDEPNYQPNEGQVMYYELLRAEDARLEGDILDPTLSLENVLRKDPSLLGFATGGHLTNNEDLVYSVKFNGVSFITTLLEPKIFSELLKLDDRTLTPNNIYYYYVRTVVNIEGTLVASEWISQPVTTSPVEPPTTLKVERTKNYDYLPSDEVVISFMAPIPADSVVPDQYDFEIAIKGERDHDFSFANYGPYVAERLTANDDAPIPPEGYQYYVYKISGFDSSTRYDIKVRIVDYKTEVPPDEEAPRSLYSNKIVYQTAVDDEDEEDKSRLEEYLAKFDRLLLELRGQPYWILLETDDTGVYKFKETYLKERLSNDVFELTTKPDFTSAEYYFPGNAFEDGHLAMLRGKIGEFTVSIRPDTISPYLSDIRDIKVDINSNKTEDFYVKLAIYTRDIKLVNGKEPLTKELNIELDIIPLEEEDIFIEVDILDIFKDLMEDGRISVEEELQEALFEEVVEDEELQEIIEKEVANISTRYQDKAFEFIYDAMGREKSIDELDTPIQVEAEINSLDTQAYIYDRGWVKTYAYRMIDGWATEITGPTAVVFAGTENEVGIGSQSAAQEMINRYDIDQTLETRLAPGNTTSKDQVYNAIASVMGAPINANPVTYLNQNGFKGVTSFQSAGSITMEEAIYLLMQLYEKISYNSINNIAITNRQAVTHINLYKPQYRQYASVAQQLGFIDGDEKPTDTILPAEMQKMLTDILTQ